MRIATLDLAPGMTVGILRHNGFLSGFGVRGEDHRRLGRRRLHRRNVGNGAKTGKKVHGYIDTGVTRNPLARIPRRAKTLKRRPLSRPPAPRRRPAQA